MHCSLTEHCLPPHHHSMAPLPQTDRVPSQARGRSHALQPRRRRGRPCGAARRAAAASAAATPARSRRAPARHGSTPCRPRWRRRACTPRAPRAPVGGTAAPRARTARAGRASLRPRGHPRSRCRHELMAPAQMATAPSVPAARPLRARSVYHERAWAPRPHPETGTVLRVQRARGGQWALVDPWGEREHQTTQKQRTG